MPLPNFLIVGAAKSGTTSLWAYLREHPQVFVPSVKEPDFFLAEDVRKVKSREEYERLFEGATAPAIGEASVRYLADPGAAARIRRTLGPALKILILLRNPVDQIHSQWGHEVRGGGETRSLAEATLGGGTSSRRGAGKIVDYVAGARYAPQVRRYLDEFGPENVRVEIFEEFFADPARAYAGVCAFLGIATDHRPPFTVHNPSGTPRSRWVSRLLGERSAWREPVKAVVPMRARDRLRSWLLRWNTRRRPLPPPAAEERGRLRDLLDADVRELERVLGRSLSAVWW